jgi:predicted transcriptional regulator
MILQASMGGATKTHLMYGAYLSYAQLQEYLGFLQGKELMMYEAGVQRYKLTEKGLHFLRVYDQISDLVSIAKTPPKAIVEVPLADENQSTATSIQE